MPGMRDEKGEGFGGWRSHLSLGLVIIAGFGLSALLRQSPPVQRLSSSPVVEAVLTDRDNPAVGATVPDITVMVFTDYQCPICRATDRALEAVRARDPRLRIVYKDWPIFGEASKYAARVALAADRQGRYLPVHVALMNTHLPLDAASVRQAAIASGVDWPRLEADLANEKTQLDGRLARNAAQAWSLGVEGTPAYIVGHALFRGGMSERALQKAISAARDRAAPSVGTSDDEPHSIQGHSSPPP
jgi:protein-disulfide isomerase